DNRQSDFIHQSEPEKTLAQHRPSHEPDVSVSRRENLINESLEISRMELNALPRRRQLSICEHHGWTIAIWPAELERVFVCTRTDHKAIDSLDDFFTGVFGNPFFVDISRTVQPRNTVVLLGDDAVKARNHVKSYRRPSFARLTAWHITSAVRATDVGPRSPD